MCLFCELAGWPGTCGASSCDSVANPQMAKGWRGDSALSARLWPTDAQAGVLPGNAPIKSFWGQTETQPGPTDRVTRKGVSKRQTSLKRS